MKNLIAKIASHSSIIEKPPVLLDIGASQKLNPLWRDIAKFSIGIAFDADDRDFSFIEKQTSDYRKLYVYNCIVSNKKHKEKSDFFLTKSPYCSSTLTPNQLELSPFHYSDLFQVEKKISINTVALDKVLEELNIDRIDWFKTDSQGTDLRLYSCIPESVQNNILVAEFEPALYEVYETEDTMTKIMLYLENKNFRLANATLKGAIQITHQNFNKLFANSFEKKYANFFLRKTPRWCEMTYFNTMENTSNLSIREYLLAWMFASILNYNDIAFTISEQAASIYEDQIFIELNKYSKKQLRGELYSIKSINQGFMKIIDKYFNIKL